ncbi:branched-chain amino acid ABC transporter substrate-binding protein [Herbaspirillum lusitanum]|uniref:Branched-chain amino acid ABC transporter substrate-binding protein n=1 Tax=Herbaspirillum lusitanum TaxID=213312 RepID=A0ABW9A6Y2_9BURK
MVALALLAVALFYSAAQAWAATPPPPASIVLIGFAAPLSEFSARHGRNAALLAIEEANKDNPRIAGQPVQFQLLEQDDKSDVVVTPYVARTLVASKVIGVVGHWSSATTMAAAPVYSDAGLAHISPTAWTRELTQKSFKTIFQMVGNNAAGLAFAADYLVRDQKLKHVFILDDGGYLGTAMAGYFYENVKTAGGEVVHRASINSKTSDFNPPLQRAQQLQPDLIFFSGRTVQSGVLTSNLPRFQMQPALLLTDNVVNEDFLRNVAKTETPVMAIVPGTPVQRRPRMAALEKKYIERYDAEMTAFGAYAYDSVHLLIAAAKKSNSLDRGKIVEALREIRYAGVTGNIGFDASGALLRPDYTLYRIEQKKWVPVKVFGGK